MKRLLAGLMLCGAVATLSGCYYDPGYSYVRSSAYVGDAYYGSGSTVVYDDGYYGGVPGYWYPGYGYGYGYPYGYGYGYGYGPYGYYGCPRHVVGYTPYGRPIVRSDCY